MTTDARLPLEEAPRDFRSPVIGSALWAAWGDALGFPLELAREPRELQERFGGGEVTEPPPWKRRVGGRFGPEVELPAGTYSDDTQLRLAVSRSLRANGRFDVEAFSKVELAVFLSYELGAGRGTRQAAYSLMRRSTRWNSNFYSRDQTRYVHGGGNGAAMRIQPHVWSAPGYQPEHYLPMLLRDAATTHGHPRGLLGAAYHALALSLALTQRKLPDPRDWPEMVQSLTAVESYFTADQALADRWMPAWEKEVGEPFSAALERTVVEIDALARTAAGLARKRGGSLGDRYADLATQVGGLRRETRGAGTISAALALWLAWEGQDDPAEAIRAAANLRHSDTDTVATMAGALLGTIATDDPPGSVQDRDLIVGDAARLDALREGRPVNDFPHPDTLRWQAPETLSDSLGLDGQGAPTVAGLGACELLHEPIPGRGNEPVGWQWVRLRYGQTLLIKRRTELRRLPSYSLPRARQTYRPTDRQGPQSADADLRALSSSGLPDNVADAVSMVIEREFDQQIIGELVMHLGRLANGQEKAGIFSALIVQAALEPPTADGDGP